MEAPRYDLSNGPSKFDLSIALFRGATSDHVDFVTMLQGSGKFLINCRITSVEAEDGSRESWNIQGYAKFPKEFGHGDQWIRFTAYFHSVRRTGTLTLVKN